MKTKFVLLENGILLNLNNNRITEINKKEVILYMEGFEKNYKITELDYKNICKKLESDE